MASKRAVAIRGQVGDRIVADRGIGEQDAEEQRRLSGTSGPKFFAACAMMSPSWA